MSLHKQNSTHALSSPPAPGAEEGQTVEIKKSLRRLDRKDVWYWWNAILVIMLLMGAIGALSLPSILHADDPNYNVQLSIAVRGLLGLVLIFNLYTLYQQYLLKQLRKHLAGQVELATEQQVRAKTFYELAILDPLTGLYNRRFCDERLKAEIQRADRHHLPLMVVVVDLDNFKQINDSFGHAAGDTVLREFSRHLNKTIRGADFAVRLGGDEFLLVLPECPPEYVGLVMSRLTPLQVDCEGIVISVQGSRGWAQYKSDDTPDALIERADRVLYEQKQTRRAGDLQDLTHA